MYVHMHLYIDIEAEPTTVGRASNAMAAISHGLVGFGGAAAGAAAVGGYVYLKGIAESYGDATSQKRCKAVEQALNRSLGRRSLPLPSCCSGGVVAVSLEPLQCATPVVQVQCAFEAILDYQVRRGKEESNPKTLVCELLKTWLREHAMDRNLSAKEVQAYRDFCRELVLDKEPWRGGFFSKCQFTTMLANVGVERDKLLAVRLRDAGDVQKLFETLKVDGYYYLLRATQVLLLTATTFEVPDAMYSMSLETLKHSAILPALLKDGGDRDMAEEMNQAWQSDACRLLRAFLEQPHVKAIMLEQEGRKASETVLPHVTRVLEVVRAEHLPDQPAGMDVVDPYVKMKIKCGDDLWWEAKTCTKENSTHPEWNEIFFVDLPMEGWDFSLEIVDDNGGALLDTIFAKSEKLGPEQIFKDQEYSIGLKPKGTFCRDVSGATLHLRFRSINFHEELQAVQRLPSVTGSKTVRSSRRSSAGAGMGLKYTDLGVVLAETVEAMDNAAYFLDLGRQASELTKLMGDMGAVLLEAQLQQLLADLAEKVQSFQVKATKLEDAVADHTMSEERRRKSLDMASAARRLFTTDSNSDSRARQSSDHLQRMQAKIEETVSELRKELSAFKGIKDSLGDAKEEADKLISRLGYAETAQRCGRVAKGKSGKSQLTALEGAQGTQALQGYVPSKSVEVFEKGDRVQIYSASQDTWYPDGVVEEVLPKDTSDGPKNSVRVKYCSGERQKLVRPDELAKTLQRL